MDLNGKAQRLSKIEFLGVQPRNFERGGREQLIYLLEAGLNPDSKLVDIGCGVLRAGYWLVHFLDADCYFGIEPHPQRFAWGMDTILEPEVLQQKRPRFHSNPILDTRSARR